MDKRAARRSLLRSGLITACLVFLIPVSQVRAGDESSKRAEVVLLSHDAGGQVLSGSVEQVQNRAGSGGITVRFSTFHGIVEAPCKKLIPSQGGLECKVELRCHVENPSTDADHTHQGYVRSNGESRMLLLGQRPGAGSVMLGIETYLTMADWLASDSQVALLPPTQ